MNKKLRIFISGVVFGALFFGTATYAAGINVDILPIKFVFDGVEKKLPADQTGFIYQGRTYVPLRFVSESLGKEVSWEGASQTAYIGKKPEKAIYPLIVFKEYVDEKNGFSLKVPNTVKFLKETVDNINTTTGKVFIGSSIITISVSNAEAQITNDDFLLNSEVGVVYMKADSSLSDVNSERIKIGNDDAIHISFSEMSDGDPFYTDIYSFVASNGSCYELRFNTFTYTEDGVGTETSVEAKKFIQQVRNSFKVNN